VQSAREMSRNGPGVLMSAEVQIVGRLTEQEVHASCVIVLPAGC
jgi:hypothetical protein